MPVQTPAVCGCPLCGGEGGAPLHDGAEPSALAAVKPAWSLAQIVDNLTRWDARWGPAEVPYTFYETKPAHLASQGDWSGFVSFSPAQREATREVFALIDRKSVV